MKGGIGMGGGVGLVSDGGYTGGIGSVITTSAGTVTVAVAGVRRSGGGVEASVWSDPTIGVISGVV